MSVVVGAVIVRDGRVLAARRTRPAELAGQWEFPGGKVEEGENLSEALVRELQEELNSTINVLDEVRDPGSPWRISDKHVLQLFLATVVAGEPTPGADHDQLRWLLPARLGDVAWLPSDLLALPAVRRAVEGRATL
ncbi:8-oxo-dGTP diphosphatase [Microbacterium trichothecenolyticum]|uniref:(deoxy)nucleoside triphosphate pyrophosphohydrolase n=1 Tax=Microbacterium trichothecenolyticum TaxID=69370 RepID=UPI00285E5F32|nr:(deoxy)nucleoside triphosphate pyrophosphohydrolase [Microbacterium trichothecenolyticum]MDR7111434.1 8-oxo-dGTP diphosphatase [Microbacterium trichothecenolyticum]